MPGDTGRRVPGVQPAASVLLGEGSTTTALSGVTSSAGVDIPGVTVTVTVGAKPIRVEWDVHVLTGTAAKEVQIRMLEGSTELGRSFQLCSNAFGVCHVTGSTKLAPSAGAHTYKLQIVSTDNATSVGTVVGATYPTLIRVIEL